ncbi:MAG TPA: NlpC/P60 family protein [Mycobacteriales bacterium]|nr:NlpC/P60 family protein [Mycobacteriales bacterium]
MASPRPWLAAVALAAAAAGLVDVTITRAEPAGATTDAARAVTVPTTPTPAATASSAPSVPVERPAWARANVATIWVKPNRPRPVDRPALLRHPRIARWIDDMTLAQRRDLTDRVMTQVLRGERVEVQRTRSDGWSRVRLPTQTGSAFPTGIIGWVPSRQLSASPVETATPAVVRRSERTGARVVQIARDYLGVRYLWGGMSSHGIDCSGLTYQVYRRVGRTLPRDAADQARVGRPVGRHHLHRGDLVFFGPGGWRTIHHVGIYAGHGKVLHAPFTGSRVQITPLRAWSDYWGARRYL